MADSDHDRTPVALNLKEAALLKLVVEAQNTPARGKKVSSVLEQVKSYQIAAGQRGKDFDSFWKHFVHI